MTRLETVGSTWNHLRHSWNRHCHCCDCRINRCSPRYTLHCCDYRCCGYIEFNRHGVCHSSSYGFQGKYSSFTLFVTLFSYELLLATKSKESSVRGLFMCAHLHWHTYTITVLLPHGSRLHSLVPTLVQAFQVPTPARRHLLWPTH